MRSGQFRRLPSRLAIVGPTFFGYIEAIAAEFTRRGCDVTRYDEKRSNSVATKALYRLGFGVGPRSSLGRYLDRVADQMIASGTADVLLVGVEVIGRSFVEKLTTQGIRVHLYMWDGQANKGRFREYLDLLTSRATFDPRDAEQLGMTYIPLFAEPVFERRADPVHDVGFCGTMHTGRVPAIAKLLSSRLRLGLKLYYHSRALFLAKGGGLRLLPLIACRPTPKAEVAELFASSRYVLDMPHPKQAGLTARTFEALLAGARLLTTNQGAPILLPTPLRNRVIVIRDAKEIASAVRALRAPLPPLTPRERYYLSLERFVDDVGGQMARHPSRAAA